MPIIKSAIKRVKVSEKKHLRNSSYKSKVRTLMKKFEISLIGENQTDVQQYYHQCNSALDKAAQKGILAKNTVSRKKSLLSKKFKLFSQSQSNKNEQTKDDEKK